MKKFFRNILLLTLFIVAVIGSLGLYSGYATYRKTVIEQPIEQAAETYFSMADYVEYEDLDEDFVNAVVAVEDKRYWSREGFDWIAMVRALYNNFRYTSREGGSTITQQIAKNLYYVGENKTRGIPEKIAEVFIMGDLEEMYSKQELLALYANMNYYGDGYWGLYQASYGYFNASPSDLTIAQAAMLAGIPNAPSAYQLSTGSDLAVSRQRKVLSRMKEEGYITEEEYQAALEEDVLHGSE